MTRPSPRLRPAPFRRFVWPIMLIMSTGAAGGMAGCKKSLLDEESADSGLPSPLYGATDGGAGSRNARPSAQPLAESFDELYPLFLMRKLGPADKTALWARYQGRWVRWTGTLIRVGPNGAQFRHIPATLTFDVSVTFDAPARARLARYRPGDRVSYLGRLDNYDDTFKTFYLSHGDVAPRPNDIPGSVDAAAPR